MRLKVAALSDGDLYALGFKKAHAIKLRNRLQLRLHQDEDGGAALEPAARSAEAEALLQPPQQHEDEGATVAIDGAAEVRTYSHSQTFSRA